MYILCLSGTSLVPEGILMLIYISKHRIQTGSFGQFIGKGLFLNALNAIIILQINLN